MIIEYIEYMYRNEADFFSNNWSCELTTLHILHSLRSHGFIQVKMLPDPDKEDFVLEIILYRRSHTFLLIKEKGSLYMVSSYLDLYKSNIEFIPMDFSSFMEMIHQIEYEDNITLHNDLFHTSRIPCLNLDKKLSQIKIHSYSTTTTTT